MSKSLVGKTPVSHIQLCGEPARWQRRLIFQLSIQLWSIWIVFICSQQIARYSVLTIHKQKTTETAKKCDCVRDIRSHVSPPFQLRHRAIASLSPALTARCRHSTDELSVLHVLTGVVCLYLSIPVRQPLDQAIRSPAKSPNACPGHGGGAALSWINCQP